MTVTVGAGTHVASRPGEHGEDLVDIVIVREAPSDASRHGRATTGHVSLRGEGGRAVLDLQTLVEIGVEKNTTIVFPAPLMSTVEELRGFLSRETTATTPVVEPSGEIELARNGGAVAADRK
jgi:hypothetical protein